MNKEDLCFTPATKLSQMIRNKEISATELIETVLERIEASGAEGALFCAPSFCDPALLDQPMLQKALDDDEEAVRSALGPEQGFSGKYRDDLTGQVLKDELVTKARRTELDFFHSKGVWVKQSIARARQQTGKAPISVRWVDVNKGDDLNPRYRSRLVARQLNAHDRRNHSYFAPTPPLKALRQWAGARLFVGGGKGLVRFTIANAAVTETALKVKKGLQGAFHKEQSERYDAIIEASLEMLDDRGFRLGFASARVSRSTTVREDATLNERRRVQFELIEALMKDFNAEIERNIRRYLGKWLL